MRGDAFEPDDRQAMIARYAELGGGLSALGDRTAARACLVDELAVVDHRPVSAIEMHDGEAYVDLLWSLMDLSEDIRWWYTDPGQPGVVGQGSIALTGHWNSGGGWAEIPVGVVFVMRGERFERIELYPPDAVDEMRTRVAALTAERADNARAPG